MLIISSRASSTTTPTAMETPMVRKAESAATSPGVEALSNRERYLFGVGWCEVERDSELLRWRPGVGDLPGGGARVVGRGQGPFGSHQDRRLLPIHPARSWCRGRGPVVPGWPSPLAGVQSRVEMGDEEDVVLSVVVEDQRGAAQGEGFTAGGTYGDGDGRAA